MLPPATPNVLSSVIVVLLVSVLAVLIKTTGVTTGKSTYVKSKPVAFFILEAPFAKNVNVTPSDIDCDVLSVSVLDATSIAVTIGVPLKPVPLDTVVPIPISVKLSTTKFLLELIAPSTSVVTFVYQYPSSIASKSPVSLNPNPNVSLEAPVISQSKLTFFEEPAGPVEVVVGTVAYPSAGWSTLNVIVALDPCFVILRDITPLSTPWTLVPLLAIIFIT